MDIITMLVSTVDDSKSLSISSQTYQHIPWLLDSLLDLQTEQTRWLTALPAVPVLSPVLCALSLISACRKSTSAKAGLLHKAHTVLALLCAKVFKRETSVSRERLLSSDSERGIDSRHAFCLALIPLAEFACNDKSISRLIKTKLLEPMGALIAEYSVSLANETDFLVCKRSLAPSIVASFANFSVEMLRDTETSDIRSSVEYFQVA